MTMSAAAGTPFGQTKFVWDSVFFARIAACGYEYEQFYAFFPALPGVHFSTALSLLLDLS